MPAVDAERIAANLSRENIANLRSIAAGGWRVGCLLDNVPNVSQDIWRHVLHIILKENTNGIVLVFMQNGVDAPIFVNSKRLCVHLSSASPLLLFTTDNTPIEERSEKILSDLREKLSKVMVLSEPSQPSVQVVTVGVKAPLRGPLVALLLGYPVSWVGTGRINGMFLYTVRHKNGSGFAFSAPRSVDMDQVLPKYLDGVAVTVQREVVPTDAGIVM